MNDHDKGNLMFLLGLTTKKLEQWYMGVSEDDRLYAEELLAEANLMAIDACVAKMQQFKEAQQVLKQYSL